MSETELAAPEVNLTDGEFFSISRSLEQSHEVFYKFWEMGKPIFTTEAETAQVNFDEKGELVGFWFNPNFWNACSEYDRKFIICHEILHVVLNHGFRGMNANNNIANVAMDIVVNHMLIRRFGFNREKITDWENYCWIETVWPDEKERSTIERNKSFEYYYALLKKNKVDVSGVSMVDSHDGFCGQGTKDSANSDKEDRKSQEEALEELNRILSDEAIEDLLKKAKGQMGEGSKGNAGQGGIKAGTGSGHTWHVVEKAKVVKKKKWETVIKKWAMPYAKEDFKNTEQWAMRNRRMSFLSEDLMLPSEYEEEDKGEPDMIEVYFFLDASGSCIHLADRFFKACRSLPEKKFKVRPFSFDCSVYDIDLDKPRICGGWGTSFDIIENKIQQIMKKEGVQYPKAVFIITDGHGNRVRPQIPENWHWFLTTHGARGYIDHRSSTYYLKDFE